MKKNLHLIVVILLFFFLTLLYLFPLLHGLILLPLDMLVSNYSPWYIPGQILVKNPYMQDSVIQLYPWKHLVFQAFQQGIIPFWNPYQFMGMPFMASMKPMIFYPSNIFYVFGEINAWHALLFSQIFLAMVFMYLLARDFKLGIVPSILSGFVFGLNSLMMGVLEFGSDGHAIVWIPLFIYCAKNYLEKQKGIYLFFLGITVGISIFSGQLQYTAYGLLLLVAFIFYYGYRLKTAIIVYGLLFLAILLGIGLSAVQLLPGLELFTYSYRGTSDSYQIFAGGLNKPFQLLRLLSPDFFGNPVTHDAIGFGYIETSGYFGIVPLFFALYAMCFARKNTLVLFFTSTFIFALLLSLQGIGQILYILHIPLITSGEGDRIFSLIFIASAILAGFGLQEFLSNHKKRNLVSLCSFGLFFILTIIATVIAKHDITNAKLFLHNISFASIILVIFFLGTIFFLFFRRRIRLLGMIFLFFILLVTYVDLFRLGYRFLTFSNKKFLYPEMPVTTFVQETSKNTLARNMGLAEPELSTYLQVYTTETYNPLYPSRTAVLLQALQGKNNEKLPINKYFLTKSPKLKYALDFLGVSLIVVNKEVNPSIELFNSTDFQDDFTLLYKDDRYAVYSNTAAYPRFNLFYETKTIKNDTQTLRILANNSLDLRKILILNESPPFALTSGTGSAKLLASTVNSQKFSIQTSKPGLFYLSDTYFPGWTATVNNKPTKIYQADYNFRAVLVPAGESIVSFSYLPSNFIVAIWISCISFLCLAIISIWHRFELRSTSDDVRKVKKTVILDS